METNTQTTREKAEQLLNSLQGEELLVEIDKLIAKVEQQKLAIENANDKYWRMSSEVTKIRDAVREYFKEEIDGDKDATVEMDVDDINGLLTQIGANEIKFTYSAEVTITFTITGVEAESEEDAKSRILDAISYEVDSSLEHDCTEDDNYEVDNVEAE